MSKPRPQKCVATAFALLTTTRQSNKHNNKAGKQVSYFIMHLIFDMNVRVIKAMSTSPAFHHSPTHFFHFKPIRNSAAFPTHLRVQQQNNIKMGLVPILLSAHIRRLPLGQIPTAILRAFNQSNVIC